MILIFDSELGGHHLEYIHHYWMGIVQEHPVEQYIIAIPQKEWERLNHLFRWPQADNIKLRLLSDEELAYKSKMPTFKRSEKESVIIGRLCRELKHVDKIILSNLAASMPLLPLYIPKTVRVTGIIYSIDYYANNHGLKKLREQLLLYLMAKDPRFDNVLLLNSKKAVEYYNKHLKTNHFKLLVDPIPQIDHSVLSDKRQEYGIPKSDIVFLHFGVMARRKGTIELLKAINLLSCYDGQTFIFAGIVTMEIESEFNELIRKIELKGIHIIVVRGFLEFNDLINLCYTSDCIVAPYLETECSSGVIGYGAALRKPIIGSDDGLLGELIRDNKLGKTVKITPPICALLFSSLSVA